MFRKASGGCIALVYLFGLPSIENSVWAQVDVKEFHKKPILFGRKALTIPPASNEEKRLRIGLYNERLAITEDAYRLFFRGDRVVSRSDCDTVFGPARRLKASGMEVLDCQAEKINFLAQLLELADRVDFVVAVNEKTYRGTPPDSDTFLAQLRKIREFRLEVQIELVRLKKPTKSVTKKQQNEVTP